MRGPCVGLGPAAQAAQPAAHAPAGKALALSDAAPSGTGGGDAQCLLLNPIAQLLAGSPGIVAVGERERGCAVPLHLHDGHRLAPDHPSHARARREIFKACHAVKSPLVSPSEG